MARKRNKYIGGTLGSLVSAVWAAYSNFTTARDLGDDAGWIGKMLADPPVYAPWLLLLGCLLFLAWVFWERDDTDDDSIETRQNSSGSSSPNVGSVGGDFHYHPPAAPLHAPKKSEYKYDLRSLDGLERALMMAPTSPPGLARYVTKPKPDLSLTGLLVRVYKALGPVPKVKHEKEAFYRKVDLEIADKVSQNDLHVWGRSDDRPLQEISRYWDDGSFKHLEKMLFVDLSYGPRARFADLHFNKREIEEVWPND